MPKILVGTDTRVSCDMLESALIAGLCSVGAEAISLGVLPSPAVAYLTRLYKADAGVIISASHNSFEFNGIKFFDSKGYKLPDAIEDRIERIIKTNSEELPRPTGNNIGRRSVSNTALKDYIEFVKSTVNTDLKGLKIAVDCANGAAYKAAPAVLSHLGVEVLILNDKPDGTNINNNCGSTHIGALKLFVLQSGADLGIAFDGDADRVLAIDEKGNFVDGDQLMAIAALELKRNGKLNNNTIVATVMSNLGLEIMSEREGIKLVKTRVGDRYVLEEMLDKGYSLGGEQSGHIIFGEYNTTGDGLITALQLLSVLKTSGEKLSNAASIMQVFPQVLKNARVRNENKNRFMDDPVIASMCRKLEEEFNGEGRVLIRPSGTEPLVRVMIEGKDQQQITQRAAELVRVIEERLS
jgi:phosphoglucosamine mutase